MKNILTRKFFLAVMLTIILQPGILTGQQTEEFKEGQKVLVYCNCLGPTQWIPGTIEKIIGPDDYQVRYGTGRYHHIRAGKDKIKDPNQAAVESKQAEMRGAFWNVARK